MTIRRVQPEDLQQLILLCKEHAEYEGLKFETKEQHVSWQQAFFGKNPKLYGWVYEKNGKLKGYMTATIDYATWTGRLFAYMDCLYLKPDARGKGIGRQFMEQLEIFAQEQQCAEIQWQTPPDNKVGIGFYRRIGAGEKAKVRFFMGLD